MITTTVRRSHFHYLPIKRRQRRSWGSELPTEVLTKIFNHIATTQDVQRLALSCHRFYNLLAKGLFRDICVDCTLYRSSTNSGRPIGRNGIRDLVLHLLRHSSFADLVLNVRLCGPQSEDYLLDTSYTDEVDVELAKAVRWYLKQPKNTSTKLAQMGVGWLALTIGDRITPLVLLLALLPQVSTVHIQMQDEKLLANSLLSLNVFSGLQAITLEWVPHPQRPVLTSLDGGHLKELLGVKALKKASAVRLASQPQYTSHGNPFSSLNSKSSSVTCLELRESRLSASDAMPLFGAFDELRSFVYEHSWNPLLGRKLIRPSTLVSALSSTHSESLESLWMDFSLDSQYKQSEFNRGSFPDSTLQKLSTFRKLKHLCLPMEFMFGYPPSAMWEAGPRCLPPTLETIVLVNHAEIRDCPVPSFLEELSAFLSDSRSQEDDEKFRTILPNLRTIIVIASFEKFRRRAAAMVPRIQKIPGLEVIFAHDPKKERNKSHVLYQHKMCTERIREVENTMGLTKIRSQRWRAIDQVALLSLT